MTHHNSNSDPLPFDFSEDLPALQTLKNRLQTAFQPLLDDYPGAQFLIAFRPETMNSGYIRTNVTSADLQELVYALRDMEQNQGSPTDADADDQFQRPNHMIDFGN